MLSKDELIKIFFPNGRFNEFFYKSLDVNDYRRYSLDHFYSDSESHIETYTRLKNNWDIVPICPTCGKKLKWINSKRRFQHHCSSSCASKDPNVRQKLKKTLLDKYGDENYNNHQKYKETCFKKYGVESSLANKELREKGDQTKIEKYGYKTYNNPSKATETCFKKYGHGSNIKSIQKTMLKKYGVKSYLSSEYINSIRNNKEIQDKIQKSKKYNHTFNTSKSESQTYKLLKEKYPDVERQYKDNRYPFNCDFYIPSLDLFIECNYHWTHGGKPYDGSPEDNLILEKWKSKNTKFYDNAINTWTIRDPKKRKIAKENSINLLEFWDMNELIDWLNIPTNETNMTY